MSVSGSGSNGPRDFSVKNQHLSVKNYKVFSICWDDLRGNDPAAFC